MLRGSDIFSFIEYSKSRFSDYTVLNLDRVSDMVQTNVDFFCLKVVLDRLVLKKIGHVWTAKSIDFVIDVPVPK